MLSHPELEDQHPSFYNKLAKAQGGELTPPAPQDYGRQTRPLDPKLKRESANLQASSVEGATWADIAVPELKRRQGCCY